MQTTTCKHKEKIVSGKGTEVGTCAICRQVRRYNTENHHEKPAIIELGRHNGMIVLPGPNDSLELSPAEAAELAAAKKAQGERHQSPSDTNLSKGDQVTTAVPPRPKKKSQLLQYFEDNKAAILEDYRQLTLRQFYAKWHIYAGTWGSLKKRWNVLGKKEEKKEAMARPGRRIDQLPPFPAFNDNWTPYVQEKWFETYRALRAMAPVGY